DEEFTVARLYVSKLKTEVKTLVHRCQQLEGCQADSNRKIEETDHQLSDCCLLLQQHEVKMKTMVESIKDVEVKKRQLEEAVDRLNEECVKLKAQGSNQMNVYLCSIQ
ncbi:PREDICTED: kinesin-1 heavy chain-like, partial [Priapulus caudatus]|uniref:Kinesin-1 heavy chain-like n=1 Tax=Priapulus caudatus TaxID=37621 RepID=A0ABM1F798_PRICU